MNDNEISIRDLAARIRYIEDTYKSKPNFHEDHSWQRLMMCFCLYEIHSTLNQTGNENTRFAIDLAQAIAMADAGHRVGLFALPRDKHDPLPRNPFLRFPVEAKAAAILEMGSLEKNRTQSEWADRIASRLADAGWHRPGKGGAYSGSAIKKWRKDCILGCHPSSLAYDNFISTHRAEGANTARLLEDLAEYCARELEGRKKTSICDDLEWRRRGINMIWPGSLAKDADIDDVRRLLNVKGKKFQKQQGRRRPVLKQPSE